MKHLAFKLRELCKINLLVVVLKIRICQTSNYLKNYVNQVLENFKKEKYTLKEKGNIQGADIADIQLISKFKDGIRFALCAIATFSKYAWVIPLKDKKGITITKPFQKILDESNRQPNKIWIDKGIEFYNRSMKSWLIMQKFIQNIMKENQLLLKDL